MKFIAEHCRVYFNKADDPTKAWSIDFGIGTPEILAQGVDISADCLTSFRPAPPDNVKAWLYLGKVEINLGGPYVRIRKFAP